MIANQGFVIVFALLYFAFIVFSRKRGDFGEFSVAGRSLGVFLIFSSLCAGVIGPGWTMGLTREGYATGFFLTYIAPIGGLWMVVVAVLFAPRVRRRFTSSYSIGDIIGGPESHDHRWVRIVVGVVSVFTMSAVAAAMSYAGGELVSNVFAISKFWSILVVTVIVTLYASMGGIRATIQTDAVQFVHFVLLIPALAVLIVFNDGFSWEGYTASASASAAVAFNAETALSLFGLFVVYALTTSGLDASVLNRYLASKSERVALRAALMAGVFMTGWVVLMLFIGSAGRHVFPGLENNDQILLHIAEGLFPGVFYGVFIVAMVGVIMSTQDTLINSGAVSFAEDILGGFLPELSDQQKLAISRGYTIALGLVSVVVASFMTSVLGVILAVVSIVTPVMIPVTMFSIVKKKHYWQAAIAGMATGLVSYLVWAWVGSPVVSAQVFGLVASPLAYIVVDLVMRQRSQQPPAVQLTSIE